MIKRKKSDKEISNIFDSFIDVKIEKVLGEKVKEFTLNAENTLKNTLDNLLNEIYGQSLKEKIEGRIKEVVKEVFEENKSYAQVVFESCAHRIIESNDKIFTHDEINRAKLLELEKKLEKLYEIVLRDEINKINKNVNV